MGWEKSLFSLHRGQFGNHQTPSLNRRRVEAGVSLVKINGQSVMKQRLVIPCMYWDDKIDFCVAALFKMS